MITLCQEGMGKLRVWSVALAVFGMGFICCFVTTGRFGIGLTPDSATYLSQADNLSSGHGLIDYSGRFTSHYPPGYAVFLSCVSVVTGRDIRHGAPRLVCALSLSGTFVASLGWLYLRRVRGLSLAAGMVALVFHPSLLEYGMCALSDCLFVAVIACSLCSLELWSQRCDGVWFCIAVACSAIGLMTRYAGIVWPVCCATALLVQSGKSWRSSAGDAGLFLLGSVTPLLMWFAGVRFVSGGGAPRSIAFHPASAEVLREGVSVICGSLGLLGHHWSVLVPLMIFSVGCLLSAMLQGFKKCSVAGGGPSSTLTVRVIGLYLIGYPMFLLLSITFLDRATPLDGRILLSCVWSLILLFTWLVHIGLRDNRVCEVGCWMLIVWFGTRGLVDTVPRLAAWRENGYGVACAEVLYDRNLKFVREVVPPVTRVYSNVSWSVWLACRRRVFQLDSRHDYTSGRENAGFEASLQNVISEVERGEAIVVLDRLFADPMVLTPTVEDFQNAGLGERSDEGRSRFVVFDRAK
jgi:hypothetical protein